MKNDSREKIYNFIIQNKPVQAKDIIEHFGLGKAMIHRHLAKLIEENVIYKTGIPPKVYYFQGDNNTINFEIPEKDKQLLQENYIYLQANGMLHYGYNGFAFWCIDKGLDINKEYICYKKTLKKYAKYKKNGIINGLEKLKQSFDEVYLNGIFYLDFYSIEKYGKTKLGNFILYGKQQGDKEFINYIINFVKPKIIKFINEKNIDSISFIPPSVVRNIQFMTELEKGLDINLKKLKLLKIFRDKIIPQKTLNKSKDRIINAKDTIFIKNKDFKSNNLLLIDDAIGSGATLNETAKKIKKLKISKKVYGISIVGSFKGFDIISEI